MTPSSDSPTSDALHEAIEEFKQDVGEEALRELFSQYPRNNNHAHVLLKVVALNRLYSTGILAVHDVAHHIHQHAQEIDAGLAAGDPEIVDKLSRVRIESTGKDRDFWSFATKYCSWHNEAEYPIWDSRVCRYLRGLGVEQFAHPDSWTYYSEFKQLMSAFRTRYQLEGFTYKQIDMFMWKHGAPPVS